MHPVQAENEESDAINTHDERYMKALCLTLAAARRCLEPAAQAAFGAGGCQVEKGSS